MARGGEDAVIQWLSENQSRGIWLSHLGLVREVKHLGGVYDAHKKADVSINGQNISLKNVESSILINRIDRDALINHYNFEPSLYDQKIQQCHEGVIRQNFPWQDVMNPKGFKTFLRTTMMAMNPKTGQSKEPADFILTHLKNIQQALDINVYSFEEFFDLFSEHWITMRIKRCWFGQASDNEHGRARALMSRPDNTP